MKNVINLAGQISDTKLLADLDAEIASTERAAAHLRVHGDVQ